MVSCSSSFAHAELGAVMTPQINAYRADLDFAAFRRRFAVWTYQFPEGQRKNYSALPAIASAYEDGRLRSCEIVGSKVHALVGATPGKAVKGEPWRESATMPGMRLEEAERLPFELLLTLLLRSTEAIPSDRKAIRDFSGTLPLVASVREDVTLPGSTTSPKLEVVLHVACDWAVHPVTRVLDGHTETLFAILPEGRGFRTHSGQWSSNKSRKASQPTIERDKKTAYIYRPLEQGRYEQIPGASMSGWQQGMLVRGASVRNAKESDIAWAATDPSEQTQTRSAVLELLPGWVKTGLGDVLKLSSPYVKHEDRRIRDSSNTVGLSGLPKSMWARIRDTVLKGRRLALIDARLTPDAPLTDKLHAGLGRVQRLFGDAEVSQRCLRLELAKQGWLEAPTKDQVKHIAATWHAEDGPEVMWVCVVDDPERVAYLPGGMDTKPVIYEAAPMRTMQSLHQRQILNMRPPKGAKRRDDDDTSDDGSIVENPVSGEPRTEPHALRSILVNLALKVEIQAGSLLWKREWLDAATPYVFLAQDDSDVGHVRYAALWFDKLQIVHKVFETRRELATMLAGLGRKPMAYDQKATFGLDDALLLRDTGMRLMPPNMGSKKGWGYTTGVSVYPELRCYSASKIGTWNGAIEKGIVLREVQGGDTDDVRRAARMCLDPSVRLNDVTVLPAPFKLIREVVEMRAAGVLLHTADIVLQAPVGECST